MSELLPIGTVVDVVEPAITYHDTDWWGNETTGTRKPRCYRGRVEGYDIGGSKYHLAVYLGGGRFTKPLAWAFPSWCTAVNPAAQTEAGNG
jgi:hypothetical protein